MNIYTFFTSPMEQIRHKPKRHPTIVSLVALFAIGISAPAKADLIELKVVNKKPIIQKKSGKKKSDNRLGSGLAPTNAPEAKAAPAPTPVTSPVAKAGKERDGAQEPKAKPVTRKASPKEIDKRPVKSASKTKVSPEAVPLKEAEPEKVITASIPKTIAECSRAYHDEILRIKQVELVALNDNFQAAKSSASRLPGKLIFKPLRVRKNRKVSNIIKVAKRNASLQGRNPLSPNSSTGWVTRQIVANLKTYMAQPYRPFLCTGSDVFLDFISPHVVKIAGGSTPDNDLTAQFLDTANAAITKALASMPQIPTPVWAPMRDQPAPQNVDLIRPTIIENDPSPVAVEDEDLPILTDREPQLQIRSAVDIEAVAAKLLTRAFDQGYLIARSNKSETSQTLQEVIAANQGDIPRALGALIAANKILRQNRYQPIFRSRQNSLHEAFSALEILFYLQENRANQMSKLGSSMSDTISALSSANQRNCTC